MPLLSLYSSRQGDSTQLLACMDTCTTTNKTYPVASPRRGSSTSCPQGRHSASCTPVHTQHAKATAHSCPYACMRTRRRASRTRLRRRGKQQRTPNTNTYSAHHGDSTQLLACVYACSYAWIRVRRQTRRTRSCRRGRGSSTSCPQGSRSTSCTPCIYAAHQGDSAQLFVCVYAHTATSILYPTASFVEEQQHMPLPDIYAARPGDSTQLLARAYACAATRKPGQLRRRGGAL